MDDQIIEQLDKTINNWADYNKVYYHPRSINEISTHEMGNPITPFDNYTIGHKAYEENERESDLFDTNFRFFVEECDRLQGFQLITDVDTGYGGFTVGLLNEVRDEFPKTPILTYGVSDSHAHHENEREKNKIILNRSISLTQISELSSIYEYSTYHTSAIIAAGIESNLLPYRLKKNPIAMADNINKLSWVRSTKLGYLSITLPLPISSNGYEDTLHNHTTKQLKPTLSYLNYQPDGSKVDVYAETYITRGLPNPVPSEYIDRIHENSKHDNDPLHDRFNVTTPFPVVDTYPRLFMPCVDMDDDSYSTPFSVPAMTEFKSGSELKKLVDEHLRGMERMRYQDFHEYILNGMSYEDFKEIKESLISLSDSYRTDDDSYMM
ncbi:tubulin domain-containing protein [Pilobolus umbonatus]|nr:tubulin domain-containing protein [Pilobolus umbonatus]